MKNSVKNVVVEYAQSKCIGAKKCIEIAPDHFSFDGEKALLRDAQLRGEIYRLEAARSEEQIARLCQAAELCPVNAIKISTTEGEVLVSDEVTVDTPKFREIQAEYDDWTEFIMDEKGYFLIRINPETKEIEVAFCPELNKITVKVTGKRPVEIYQTLIKEGLLSRMDHAAYLGRELQKAYLAIQKRIRYVQDDELSV